MTVRRLFKSTSQRSQGKCKDGARGLESPSVLVCIISNLMPFSMWQRSQTFHTHIHWVRCSDGASTQLGIDAWEKKNTDKHCPTGKHATAACQRFVYAQLVLQNHGFCKHHASFHSPLKDGISQKCKRTRCQLTLFTALSKKSTTVCAAVMENKQ